MFQPCVVCQQRDIPTTPAHYRYIDRLTIADMLSEFAVFDVSVPWFLGIFQVKFIEKFEFFIRPSTFQATRKAICCACKVNLAIAFHFKKQYQMSVVEQQPEATSWMCFQCNLTFDHYEAYKLHLEKHPPIDLVSDSDGENKNAMDINKEESNSASGGNEIATSSSFSAYSNDTEMSDLPDERPFKCSICARRFKTKGQSKAHAARHTNQLVKKKANIKCLKCNRIFLVKTHLNSHKCLGKRKSHNV